MKIKKLPENSLFLHEQLGTAELGDLKFRIILPVSNHAIIIEVDDPRTKKEGKLGEKYEIDWPAILDVVLAEHEKQFNKKKEPKNGHE